SLRDEFARLRPHLGPLRLSRRGQRRRRRCSSSPRRLCFNLARPCHLVRARPDLPQPSARPAGLPVWPLLPHRRDERRPRLQRDLVLWFALPLLCEVRPRPAALWAHPRQEEDRAGAAVLSLRPEDDAAARRERESERVS